jgi:hypothetical protein
MARFVALVLTLLLIADTTHAYILPADYVIRILAIKRRAIKVRDMSLQLTAELAGHPEPVEERLYLKWPERLRLLQQNDTERIYVEREGAYATGEKDNLTRHTGRPPDLLATLFAPGGDNHRERQERILKTLRAAGIDDSVISLGRFEKKPTYVIGARPWETQKPQVWIDKTTFFPVRYVLHTTIGSQRAWVETRLLDYGSELSGERFPRVMEQYRDGRLVRRAEVTKILVNKSLPETLFDLPRSTG